MKLYKQVALFFSLIIVLTNINVFAEGNVSYGQSSILIDRKSGRVLYKNNENLKLPMASTTKIMTALIALENGELDDIVKIDKRSVGIEGSSIYLREGEEISLRDLLYGLMLRSGNDAAVAIAIHISGSIDDFVKLMNDRAKEIGAINTNFVNPHGLHNDNHYTTAYDLALITREAMKNDEFRKIVKTKLWVADRDINKYFYNKNKTLWQYEGGDGVKIGYTQKSGRCLVSSATKNGMQLIAVTLNNNSWFQSCYNLFDYGFNNYKPMVVYDKGQFIGNIYVSNGKKDTISAVTADSCVIPLKEDEVKNIKIVTKIPESLQAPIYKGQKIGIIKVFMNGSIAYIDDLVAKEDILEKNWIEKILDRIFIKKTA